MNNDQTNPSTPPELGAELEARIVAWVTGEASAFEIAELERLAAERPEIAIFKRRIAAVQGLVAEAMKPDKPPLHLAPERRASLLRTIGAEAAPEGSVGSAPEKPRLSTFWRQQKRERQWILAGAAAASLLIGMAREERQKSVALALPASSSDFDEDVSTGGSPRTFAVQAMPPPPPGADVHGRTGAQVVSRGYISAPKFAPTVQGPAMEPFEVNATSDVGYQATSTLAGTRVRTDLKDVAGATSVATPQFMQDVGATDEARLQSDDATSDDGRSGRNSLSGATGAGRSSGFDWAAKTGDIQTAAAVPPTVDIPVVEDKGADVGGQVPESRPNQSGYELLADRFHPSDASAAIREEVLRLSPFEVASSDNEQVGAMAETASAGAKEKAEADARTIQAARNVATGALRAREIPGAAGTNGEPAKPAARTEPPVAAPVETSAAEESVSTFSLHVSDVSFRLAQAALARGEAPDPAAIRPEEFYNAFDYGDPGPGPAEKISCRVEQSAHPFLQQRNFVRIAMRVPATGRGAGQALHLTVLLDTSGSMEREDRAAAVQRALAVLVSLLGPNDRLTLIGFARRPRLLAENQRGDQAGALLAVIAHTPAEGGTNFEEALKLGGELARRHFDPQAQNRLVLLTDGAANLGNADPAQLARLVDALRQQGIAFDACGVGMDGIDDTMLEALTRKGDGRYCVLDTPESADAGFAHQLAGAFRPAAKNVKVQVRFNPARVGRYRLIGFERHRLRTEDFRNDRVDAAELAAEEAAVALYQVEVLPQGEGELGEVYVRFRDMTTDTMVERSWTMTYEPQAPAFDRAAPSMQLAGTAALLAEKLRGGSEAGLVKLDDLSPVVNTLRGRYQQEARVQELVAMFEQIRRMERR